MYIFSFSSFKIAKFEVSGAHLKSKNHRNMQRNLESIYLKTCSLQLLFIRILLLTCPEIFPSSLGMRDFEPYEV
jgi:hypothetical protein